jgi:hypothetical protein
MFSLAGVHHANEDAFRDRLLCELKRHPRTSHQKSSEMRQQNRRLVLAW